MTKKAAILAILLSLTLTACSDKKPMHEVTLRAVTGEAPLTIGTTTASETAAAEETSAVSETEAAVMSVDYKKDYAEFMNELEFYGGGIYIGDINGDNIPEAVFEINSCEYTVILYYNEDGMQQFWIEGDPHGYVRYIPDENMIVYSPWFSRGFADVYVYQWTGSTYETVYTLSGSVAVYGEDMSWANVSTETGGTINDEEVTPEEFEAAYHEFEELWKNYEYFPVVSIDDKNFENYVKENLPDFDNWDIFDNY